MTYEIRTRARCISAIAEVDKVKRPLQESTVFEQKALWTR